MTKTEADTLTLHRFTVAQYRRLDELGAFNDTRVELLEGCIVTKERYTPPHAVALHRLFDAFRGVPEGWTVRDRAPITLTDSEPEPDLAVVVGETEDYATRHPAATEVAFVVEMADSTLHSDRVTKGRIYASAGIPVYWIVNLPERQLEIYTRPNSAPPPGYRATQLLAADAFATVNIGPNVIGPIAVADLLPPA